VLVELEQSGLIERSKTDRYQNFGIYLFSNVRLILIVLTPQAP
jgi:hypothetical protein